MDDEIFSPSKNRGDAQIDGPQVKTNPPRMPSVGHYTKQLNLVTILLVHFTCRIEANFYIAIGIEAFRTWAYGAVDFSWVMAILVEMESIAQRTYKITIGKRGNWCCFRKFLSFIKGS